MPNLHSEAVMKNECMHNTEEKSKCSKLLTISKSKLQIYVLHYTLNFSQASIFQKKKKEKQFRGKKLNADTNVSLLIKQQTNNKWITKRKW